MKWLACAMAFVVAAATPALAQRNNRDYYEPDAQNVDRELRRNVESHHLEAGMREMRVARWPAAKSQFEFILNYYPNHPVALNLISELCDVRWVDARCDSESWFARAIARNPGIAQTYVLYAIHLQRKKQLDQAIETFNHALSMNPKLMNAHYNLGLAYLDKRDYALANRHAQISYHLGAPLPGLRNKLVSAKQWRELSAEELRPYLAPQEAAVLDPGAKKN